MKLFKNKQLLLRIIAVVAESILFYIVYLFANEMLKGSSISIIFFIITALCGLLVNLLPINHTEESKQRYIIGFIGLGLAIISIAIASAKGFSLFAVPVGFVALISLYYRSYISYLSNVLYVYTIGSFYRSAAILFMINVVVVLWSSNFSAISEEQMRYSVFYIIMALYMLSEVRNFRYVSKNENAHKGTFDIVVTSLMIIFTVIMSIPKVFKIVTFPFVVVFKFIYVWAAKLILILIQPIVYFISYLFGLVDVPTQEGIKGPGGDSMSDINEKLKELAENQASPFVQFIGTALAFTLMLLICALVVYILFKFVNRITKTEEEDDFEEEKQFVLNKDKKANKILGKLASAMRKAAGSVSFMINADNRDKLRSEYKKFIHKLYNRKVIVSGNYTAQDIMLLILAKLPNQKDELISITSIYEAVRYGTKYPEDIELKSFKRDISKISKNLQQTQ